MPVIFTHSPRGYTQLYRASLVPANLTGENPYWESDVPFFDALFWSVERHNYFWDNNAHIVLARGTPSVLFTPCCLYSHLVNGQTSSSHTSMAGDTQVNTI